MNPFDDDTDAISPPQTPQAARDVAAGLLDTAGMAHTIGDFLTCCRPFHPSTERPVAGRFEYASRMQQSAIAWIRASKRERDMLVAGSEDGVLWRGEDMRQFQDVWIETQRMRDMGRDAYVAEVKAKLNAL